MRRTYCQSLLNVLESMRFKGIKECEKVPWGLQAGVPTVGFPGYWFAPGARLHLHVRGLFQGGEVGLEKHTCH